MATNGSSSHPKVPLRAGVYAPILTIFDPKTEDLDLEAQAKHSLHLAESGLVGLVVMGSNGEAVHLTHQERIDIIKTTRTALDKADYKDVAVIAGCTAQSVRESVQMCKDAYAAGAGYALILPPCYFRPAMSDEVIYQFFKDVADESPIGLLMYNYPGAVAGIDMSSDLINRISTHPNVVGVKFTCGQTGKLTRVAAAQGAITSKSNGNGYLATGGLADMTIQTAISGGSGVIAGTANIIPKVCVKVWNLWAEGKAEEAQKLQVLLAKADWALARAVVPGTKATLQAYYGYGGKPRRPLPALDESEAKTFVDGIAEAMKLEKTL